MKISEILKKYSLVEEYFISCDSHFDTLAIIDSNIKMNKCTFIDLEEYIDKLDSSFTLILTNKNLSTKIMEKGYSVCVVEDPRLLYFKVHNALSKSNDYTREVFKTKIAQNCKIHSSAFISDNSVIIGENTIIEENVIIRENTTIGNNVIIRANSIIGGDDFEFKKDGDKIISVKHLGGVIIEDNVEIQYHGGINKALYPWDNTVIGEYSKIDMYVHIAHGVKIGKRNYIVANTGIGGRVTIGDDCWIGFGATIRNGITISNKARVNMGSVVTKDVGEGQSVSGNFAIEHSKFMDLLKKGISD